MEVTRLPCPDTDQDTFVAVITDDEEEEKVPLSAVSVSDQPGNSWN